MSKNNNFKSALPPTEVRIGKLNTIEDIRNEMARLYRAARKTAGASPDAATASKLAYLLNHIAKSIEGTDLERRISELEDRI